VSGTEVERAVQDVLRTVLGRTLSPGEDLLRVDEPKWDSLKHVEVLFCVEQALGIEFEAQELGELDSLGKLVAAAERQLRLVR
jgi:acyl carrier protein